MPFIAADGDNYETANAYCSVAHADDYHSLRGNGAWAAAGNAAKQAALVKASDYLDRKYVGRFAGEPMAADVLAWPRRCTTYATNAIPTGIKNACAEAALDALAGSLSPNIAPIGAIKRDKTDVLETEYFEPGSQFTVRPVVDGWMRPYISSASMNVPVVRV